VIRVLYLGQKWIGERCLELLLAHPGIELCAVVTNPGSDTWWGTRGVFVRARSLGLSVVSNAERNDDAIAELAAVQGVDAIVSVQHPWIVRQHLLDLVGGAAFNLHSAKLPDYRGYNAVNHAILNGDGTYTVTLHWMVAEPDSGGIAFEETIPVGSGETARGLYERALAAGERAFVRFLDALAEGRDAVPRTELQGEGQFFPRSSIDPEREIRSLDDSEEVDVRSRALYFPPFEPAYYRRDGRKHYVLPDGFETFAHEFRSRLW